MPRTNVRNNSCYGCLQYFKRPPEMLPVNIGSLIVLARTSEHCIPALGKSGGLPVLGYIAQLRMAFGNPGSRLSTRLEPGISDASHAMLAFNRR